MSFGSVKKVFEGFALRHEVGFSTFLAAVALLLMVGLVDWNSSFDVFVFAFCGGAMVAILIFGWAGWIK